MFQVPKGMLQTMPSNPIPRFAIMFQVPKGMLQTKIEGVFRYWYDAVSSPQGNATNAEEVVRRYPFGLKFQVPKGMLQTTF